MFQLPLATRLLPSNVPLHCNICAKKPDFSDLSHLLTHIASKGHLSTYYKLKVRSTQEEPSRRLIEAYDAWYAAWNIEDLMSDRMNLKDQRKELRSRVPKTGASRLSARDNSTAIQSVNPPLWHPVDPRLANDLVKHEVNSQSAAPLVDPSVLSASSVTFNPYVLPLPQWPMFNHPVAHVGQDLDQNESISPNESSAPSFRQGMSTTSRDSLSFVTGDDNVYDVPNGDDALAGVASEILDEGTVNDPNKLKGVYWPGMNMFDSATPDARRKRNQKKATSVVEQLEAMSNGIEPTEFVFSPSGDLRRARFISGFPNSDSSPLKGESSPPKKAKRTNRRKPLTEKDPNTSRRPRTKSKKETLPYHGAPRPHLKDVEEDDDDLTYGRKDQRRRRKKRRFDVHKDEETSFERPASMELLTSKFDQFSQENQPEQSQATSPAPLRFRPANIDNHNHHGYSTFEPSYLANPIANPFSLDQPFQSAWDFLGQDLGGPLTNPLFNGSFPADMEDDDERTISALVSEV